MNAKKERAVWERCWCYRIGRCLVDCPTADLPHPNPMTDENWRRAYNEVVSSAPAMNAQKERAPGLGWCSECLDPIYRVSVSKRGKWFGPCGHTDARLLTEAPVRWSADDEYEDDEDFPPVLTPTIQERSET